MIRHSGFIRHLKIPPSRLRTFARLAASGRRKMLRYLKPQRVEFTSTRIVGKDIHFVRVPTGCALACGLIAPNEEAAKFVPLGGQLSEPIHTVARFERGVFTL